MRRWPIVFVSACIVAVIAALGVIWHVSHTENTQAAEEEAVRELVIAFGMHLKNVPLSAPEEQVQESIRDEYGPFVTQELLSRWINDPVSAPGRRSLGERPDHLEIDDIEPAGTGFSIDAEVVEVIEPGPGAASTTPREVPVVLNAVEDGGWLISDYEPAP